MKLPSIKKINTNCLQCNVPMNPLAYTLSEEVYVCKEHVTCKIFVARTTGRVNRIRFYYNEYQLVVDFENKYTRVLDFRNINLSNARSTDQIILDVKRTNIFDFSQKELQYYMDKIQTISVCQ